MVSCAGHPGQRFDCVMDRPTFAVFVIAWMLSFYFRSFCQWFFQVTWGFAIFFCIISYNQLSARIQANYENDWEENNFHQLLKKLNAFARLCSGACTAHTQNSAGIQNHHLPSASSQDPGCEGTVHSVKKKPVAHIQRYQHIILRSPRRPLEPDRPSSWGFWIYDLDVDVCSGHQLERDLHKF